MHLLRIVTIAAALGMAVGIAHAQTAPGKPLPLLQILAKPSAGKPKLRVEAAHGSWGTHLRPAHNVVAKRALKARHVTDKVASRHRIHPVESAAANAPSAFPNVQPAAPRESVTSPPGLALAAPDGSPTPASGETASPSADSPPITAGSSAGNSPTEGPAEPATAPGAVASGTAPAPEASSDTAPADNASATADAAVNEMVVDGQTVKIASPDVINDLDRAADKPAPAEAAALRNDFAAASQPHVMMAATAIHAGAKVGTASWIAKVLAALGGAVAAGSAAWFMIGSAPPRIASAESYSREE